MMMVKKPSTQTRARRVLLETSPSRQHAALTSISTSQVPWRATRIYCSNVLRARAQAPAMALDLMSHACTSWRVGALPLRVARPCTVDHCLVVTVSTFPAVFAGCAFAVWVSFTSRPPLLRPA